MPEHWFFLSYARADGDYLTKFFTDVAHQVRSKEESLSVFEPSDIGFMDRVSTEPGDDWNPALLGALQRAQILVCVLSRGYLASEYCGKELEIFRGRVAAYTAQLPEGKRPRLIMPVFWHPRARLGKLPDVLARIQYDHTDYGERYLEKGLFALANQSRHRDDYHQFLDAFTWKLVDAVREHPLPPVTGGPSLSETVNAFRTPGEQAQGQRQAGPTSIRFVFVAGRQHEIGQVRDQVDAYGQANGRDWRPFFPELATSVGALSSGAVSAEDLFPEDLSIGPDIVQRIREAETENSIVLLMVDPWSVRLRPYREFLESYDEASFVNSGVIVLWNPSDEATVRQETALRTALNQAISRTCVMNGHVRDSVLSADQLRKELVLAVHEIRRRMAARGSVFQNARSGESYQLPQIAGPGGES